MERTSEVEYRVGVGRGGVIRGLLSKLARSSAPAAQPDGSRLDLWETSVLEGDRIAPALRAGLQSRPATTAIAGPRRPDTVALLKARGAGNQLVEIAKFLQVNGAVGGLSGHSNFNLPRGRFSARCSLWRGSAAGTPFLMGA